MKVITDAISGDTYPTMSFVYPTVMELLQDKLKLHLNNDSKVVQNFKTAMKASINKHFNDDTQRDLMEICSFLDPR